MNVPRMVRKYAQDAHKRYTSALERVREILAERPGDFTGERFTKFYAARALYNIYNEPLALDAVGNTAFTDDQVVERIRAERAHALSWLLTSRPHGDAMHALTAKITEDETRRFLANTSFLDEEPEQLTGLELLESLRAADEYVITTADATLDEITRGRTMSASQVVHLFGIALDEGRTVTGTRDRITALTREDGTESLTALRLDENGKAIL